MLGKEQREEVPRDGFGCEYAESLLGWCGAGLCWAGGLWAGPPDAPLCSPIAVTRLPAGLLQGPQHRALQAPVQNGADVAHLAAGGAAEHQVAAAAATPQQYLSGADRVPAGPSQQYLALEGTPGAHSVTGGLEGTPRSVWLHQRLAGDPQEHRAPLEAA